ncbi:MAG: aminopeptidase P family protein [Alphaproteobacteria bacterium]|jgi:Xaa-Pro aminopeptidase|nr:aminopeptidase P family protein [Alphaproteobacteria bacterium]
MNSKLDDTALAAQLAAAGCRLDAAGAAALIAGIAAAPAPHVPGAWLSLFVETPADAPQALTDALAARIEVARAGIAIKRPEDATEARLAKLRAALIKAGAEGFIVPRGDEHLGEYVAGRGERLAWLTGFTGSAGLAIVLPATAALFTDGRYTLQAEAEVSASLYDHCHITDTPPATWLKKTLQPNTRLGYDPRLHTAASLRTLATACTAASATLVALEYNPLDSVWEDQPPAPLSPVVPHDVRYAGQAAEDKRTAIGQSIAGQDADAALLSAPDSIAWLLNIRGADVPNCPLPLGFALAHHDGRVDLFMDERKVPAATRTHLGNAVSLESPDAMADALVTMGRAGQALLVDENATPDWFGATLTAAGGRIVKGADPCTRPKALKNAVELDGTREAHMRDGAALTRFLAWLDGAIREGTPVDELTAAARLGDFRAADPLYCGPSFDTISGAGPNGAIVHYRVDETSNRMLEPGSLYLVDSGGQYLDGTTDVTRTVAIGEPDAEMRDRFTRVLKGHIALACARFPAGTNGAQLDTLARQHLWPAGLDYDHGTGHGVGSFLNVHEGPQRISKGPGGAALEPGMIISNEPGYYKSGAWGIRIENLVTVIEPVQPQRGERNILAFETLTLAPIDRRLIDVSLLSAPEIAWVDAYHGRVGDEVRRLIEDDGAVRKWLRAATRPLDAD